VSERAGRPVMFTLTSAPVDDAGPWVVECEEGTPVVRLLAVSKAAS